MYEWWTYKWWMNDWRTNEWMMKQMNEWWAYEWWVLKSYELTNEEETFQIQRPISNFISLPYLTLESFSAFSLLKLALIISSACLFSSFSFFWITVANPLYHPFLWSMFFWNLTYVSTTPSLWYDIMHICLVTSQDWCQNHFQKYQDSDKRSFQIQSMHAWPCVHQQSDQFFPCQQRISSKV